MERWLGFVFVLREHQYHMVCVDILYWHGLRKQTSDGHCPELDGTFREEALLSIGMGRHYYSGQM